MKKTSTLLCVIVMMITAGTLCARPAAQNLSLNGNDVPFKESENPSYKLRDNSNTRFSRSKQCHINLDQSG